MTGISEELKLKERLRRLSEKSLGLNFVTFTFVISDTGEGVNVTNNLIAQNAVEPEKIFMYAKTAPLTGDFTAEITANGDKVADILIKEGENYNTSDIFEMPYISGESVMGLNVTNSGGANNVTVQLQTKIY